MEIQLQELINQIKKDGVETAEIEATAKLHAAEAEAAQIIAEAKAEADKILKQAKEENARFVRASEDAIRQAGRNLLISFRESVTRELDALVAARVSALDAQEEAALIIKVVEALAADSESDGMSVLLNQADMKTLEAALIADLKAKLLTGVTLQASDRFDGGFRVGIKDGAAYYDFSDEAVTDMLSNYLNPRVTALLKEAEGK